MDACRVERLLWSPVFASLLASAVVVLVAPDPTGPVGLGAAALTFAVGAVLVVRPFEWSASFAAGWLAASYGARRLNPVRRRRGTTA
jgi:hypothetical protein